MKKQFLLSAYALSFSIATMCATPSISWHEARKAIIRKAQYVTKTYDVVKWTKGLYEVILSDAFDTQAWQLAEQIINEILPTLPIYQEFLKNPADEILYRELTLHLSLISGHVANQINEDPEFINKVDAILTVYIDILKEVATRRK